MKRYLRIIIPLVIICVALVIATGIAFADDEYVPTKAILTSSDSKPDYGEYFLKAGTGSSYNVFEFTAPTTGKLYFDVSAYEGNSNYVKTIVGTFDGSTISYYDSNYGYTGAGQTETYLGRYDVVKGQKYVIGLNSYGDNQYVKVRTYVYSYANNRTIKEGSTYTIASSLGKGTGYDESTIFYKIVPNKTGVMTVTLKNYGSSYTYGKVTLFNSSKKLRSETVNAGSYKVKFGVKKGTAYYLKVSDVSGSYSEGYKYGIKYTISSATDRNISKKTKAFSLKRGASATGTLFTANGASETDWYKFSVTKKRKTVVKVDASNMSYGPNSKLSITFYRGSKKIGVTRTVYGGDIYTYTLTYGTTSGKANKGTYYVKVVKTAKMSGKYTVRYVQ